MHLYNIEAEQAYLGGCLINNAAIYDLLEPYHFADDSHNNIYTVMIREIAKGKTASPVLLSQIMADEPLLNDVGGNEYLARLSACAVSILNTPEYGQLIIDLWKRRKIIEIANNAIGQVQEDTALDEPLNILISELNQVSQSSEVGRGLIHVSESSSEILSDIESDEPSTEGVTVGLKALDDATGLLKPGQSIVLAGRPGMGKTALALAMAKGSAKAGHGTAFFSHEMPRKELVQRLLSDVVWSSTSPIPYHDIGKHGIKGFLLDSYQKHRLTEAHNRVKAWPLFIEDQSGMTVPAIYARCQELIHKLKKSGQTLDIVFIDYLGLLKSSGNHRGNRVQEVGEMSRDIKQLAKRLNVPVVILAQLNRSVESRENKRPVLSDLRDTGEIEQDADKVLFVYRGEYYAKMEQASNPDAEIKEGDENHMEVIISKQRGGATGVRHFFCSIENNVVRDMAHG